MYAPRVARASEDCARERKREPAEPGAGPGSESLSASAPAGRFSGLVRWRGTRGGIRGRSGCGAAVAEASVSGAIAAESPASGLEVAEGLGLAETGMYMASGGRPVNAGSRSESASANATGVFGGGHAEVSTSAAFWSGSARAAVADEVAAFCNALPSAAFGGEAVSARADVAGVLCSKFAEVSAGTAFSGEAAPVGTGLAGALCGDCEEVPAATPSSGEAVSVGAGVAGALCGEFAGVSASVAFRVASADVGLRRGLAITGSDAAFTGDSVAASAGVAAGFGSAEAPVTKP